MDRDGNNYSGKVVLQCYICKHSFLSRVIYDTALRGVFHKQIHYKYLRALVTHAYVTKIQRTDTM